VHCKYVPGTYRPLANKDNDYLMDREAQRVGTTYSGIEGIAIQDSSLQESMGPIIDRTKENLVGCDNGIIMMRHKIMRAAKALREKGTLPPARSTEEQAVRSTALLLKRNVHFKDGAKEALKAKKGVPQTTV
jgi:phthalate 4,5-dioxygenase